MPEINWALAGWYVAIAMFSQYVVAGKNMTPGHMWAFGGVSLITGLLLGSVFPDSNAGFIAGLTTFVIWSGSVISKYLGVGIDSIRIDRGFKKAVKEYERTTGRRIQR